MQNVKVNEVKCLVTNSGCLGVRVGRESMPLHSHSLPLLPFVITNITYIIDEWIMEGNNMRYLKC